MLHPEKASLFGFLLSLSLFLYKASQTSRTGKHDVTWLWNLKQKIFKHLFGADIPALKRILKRAAAVTYFWVFYRLKQHFPPPQCIIRKEKKKLKQHQPEASKLKDMFPGDIAAHIGI